VPQIPGTAYVCLHIVHWGEKTVGRVFTLKLRHVGGAETDWSCVGIGLIATYSCDGSFVVDTVSALPKLLPNSAI